MKFDHKSYEATEQLVKGRNGSLYYIFISDVTIAQAIREGEVVMDGGYPKAVRRPWEKIRVIPWRTTI